MRTLSATVVRALLAQETDEAVLLLLTLSAPGITPIRVTSDGVDTVSRGQTFVAYPFDIEGLDGWSGGDRPAPQPTLTIDNVDRTIVTAARQLSSRAAVTLEVVLASAPSDVITTWDMALAQVTWDVATVRGTLVIEPVIDEPVPGDSFDPTQFPAAFGRLA